MNLNSLTQKAFSLSQTKWDCRTFHVTFAVLKHKVIGYGINKAKTHPTNLRNPKENSSGVRFERSKLTCSELNCLSYVKNLTNIPYKNLTLVNFRIDKSGKLRYSKPCESCRNMIEFFEIKQVIYSLDSGEFEKLKVR